jgi:ketosteroid isomerase-like protein
MTHQSAKAAATALLCLSAALAGGALVSACSRSSPDTGAALARQWLDGLNSHDPERVIELLTADATYWDSTSNAPVSADAFRARLQQEAAAWKDRVYSARRIISTGDSIVIEWHIQQTHPSGESVPLDGATVLDVHDGRVQAARTYFNAVGYLRFLSKH